MLRNTHGWSAQAVSRFAGRGRLAVAAAVMAGLSACSQWEVAYDEPVNADLSAKLRVTSVAVDVPATLKASEANLFAPDADIVWHGDLPGDRHEQVDAIVTKAARQAVRTMRGPKAAKLNIVVNRFHGITPKTQYSAPSAVHNIAFTAQLTDARTGKPLTEPTFIRADLAALVGKAAIAAQSEGITQKSRVTSHIEAVLRGWLGIGPDIRGASAVLLPDRRFRPARPVQGPCLHGP